MKKVFCILVFVLFIKCASTGELKALSAESTQTSRDFQIAVDKAKQDARIELAQQLNSYVQALIKKFDEEVGKAEDSELLGLYSKTGKIVVDESLIGSHIKEKNVKQEDNIFRATVVMEAPLGQARQKLLKQIQTSDALYKRFENSKSFKELEKEVEEAPK